MDDANPWSAVAEVARVFEALGLRYAVGGSLASSVAGEGRSTQDANISVDLIGILRVQGSALDRDYLRRGADALAVSDLLARAFGEE